MQLSKQYLWILYFWKGLLSQCTRARAKQEVILFVHDRMDCDNKTQQIGLNSNYNMTFFISLRECWHSIFKRRMNILLETRTISRANPACYSLCHVVPLNNGNYHLTMPVLKGRCARDALPDTFNIGVYKCCKQFYHNKTYLQWIPPYSA